MGEDYVGGVVKGDSTLRALSPLRSMGLIPPLCPLIERERETQPGGLAGRWSSPQAPTTSMCITLGSSGTGSKLEGCWMEAIRCSVTGMKTIHEDVMKLTICLSDILYESGFELRL